MGSRVTVTVSGLPQMKQRMQYVRDILVRELANELYTEFSAVMEDSKANYVPVDQGTLRDSGYVKDPVIEGEHISVEMGYGGPDIPYALIQHEDLTFNHPGGRQAKYLERPMLEAAPGMTARMAPRIRLKMRNV